MTVRPRPTPPVPSSPFAAVDFWVKGELLTVGGLVRLTWFMWLRNGTLSHD